MALMWFGAPVFEPLAFALFLIALTAPFMQRLQPRVGKGLALVATLMITLATLLLFGVAVMWGIARVTDWVIGNLSRFEAERPTLRISEVCRDVSVKFGLYRKVRVIISLVDALICYIFFRLIGLDEPLAWAILVGTLNFIPFIGPLIVALFLGIFAAAQFGSLWMALLAVGSTTAINFVLGSYIEPLIAGSALSMSAVLVLFSVFFWAIVWGIPGAFIGVQIMILLLAVLRVVPSVAWIAELLSGDGAEKRGG